MLKNLIRQVQIKIANGDVLKANKKVILNINCDGKVVNVEGLIVPDIFQNILSVKR